MIFFISYYPKLTYPKVTFEEMSYYILRWNRISTHYLELSEIVRIFANRKMKNISEIWEN